ncbi:uncharacterized protein LOC131165643 isoform X2 [Malania oleifera]|uniref:uncharacterized protein LOC131165643 isoform X2 n=1 Tax=Malania oleifera TaxID=397392 RepID=UPI0025ADFDA3|nr:uncharacterized protein LOC131165643 isoform X2 [Malania oleifera]
MGIQSMPSSSPVHLKISSTAKMNPSWARSKKDKITIFFKSRISYHTCYCQWQREQKTLLGGKLSASKTDKVLPHLKERRIKGHEKRGTITGAIALIIGTSIGSGILMLPKKTSPAGLFPSSICMIVCWGFLLIEALLLVEINVSLLRKKRKKVEENDLAVISIRTMAQETLGEWGGTLATAAYIFLGYTSVIAYCSKSGEILFHLFNLPASLSCILFTAFFTTLISIGGTRVTDQVNQWLTASVIGLLLGIEALAVASGGWSGLGGSSNWGKAPDTVPVIIFALVYHDIAPEGDLKRIRASVLLGSIIPLLAMLIWDAIALGLSAQADQVQVADPVELLMRVRWNGISFMVEAFSLLALGTSLIGTLLSFSQFFKEQLNNLSWHSPPSQSSQERNKTFGLREWWRQNKVGFTATAVVVVPSLVVSTTVPEAFSAATDIAGGYCMTLLYGVLPPAMAWTMSNRDSNNADDENALSRARPALLGVGLFACGIVFEQILQGLSLFHP